ncbi:hypothetical protein ANANG_G00141900 [Anguilla anguilla]|uniref:ELKS/Rab6-interacting/CAST family member 1 n=1 Tax=Anguilla anguilla TaxID=7936 RepID=A0A9D3MAX9_ANGAN|nr:hypothetical protein ANANG_G00141900 [Anguilla anguilla]
MRERCLSAPPLPSEVRRLCAAFGAGRVRGPRPGPPPLEHSGALTGASPDAEPSGCAGLSPGVMDEAMRTRVQEALLAAISEKDANIALLELSSSKKKKTQDEVALLKREKDRLVQQLKQQTQNRMKLMADNYEDDHLKASSHSEQTNHKPSPDQDDEEGIWA